MRKVLMVSFIFYPSAEIGAHRAGKSVRYLPEFGWEPIVLTIKEKHCNLPDEALCSQIPPQVKVIRSGYVGIELLKPLISAVRSQKKAKRTQRESKQSKHYRSVAPESWFDLPRVVGWLPFGLVRGINVAKRCDAIWATSPPVGSLCLGALLSKLTGKPFVADLRDPWRVEDAVPYPTMLHRKINQRWERFVLDTARMIIFTSDEAQQMYRNKYPGYGNKTRVIHNGYDPDDLSGCLQSVTSVNKEYLNLGYFGSLYQGRQEYMLELMRAIREITERSPDKKVKVYIRGQKPERAHGLSNIAQITELLDISGPIPYKDALEMMRDMDLLVLVGSRNHTHALPGKMFEYMGAGKPILALTCSGAISRFVQHYQIGVCVDPFKNEQIEPALQKLTDNYEFYVRQIKAVAPEFTRRAVTGKLAGVLNQILSKS